KIIYRLELTTCTDKVLSSERLPHLKFVIKIDDQQHTGIYRFSDLLTTPGLGGKYQITPDTLLKADYYHVKGDGRFLLWSNSGYAIDDQNNMYSNEFDTVSLGITHQFTPQIRSTLGYGYMKAKDDNRFAELQRTSTTQNKQLWQGWVNALYNPYKPITLGIEYVYGERETFDNRNGIDNRFNMIASYDF
ncbi:DcaP family trimeric outer membrane transporter, partial [Acinetobacter baumannii]|nr:DcaP family trimeric outer membrane transporter [Acinetobacter baumannii]